MGEVRVGQEIFDETGKVCRVTRLSEINQTPKLFEFVFDDGSKMVSCVNHQWLTYDNKELGALTKRTPEYREKRRKLRPSRAKGNKSKKFVESISARNTELSKAAVKPQPQGSVRTTGEIVETLRTKSGRANHAVPVQGCLCLPESDLKTSPYVLGAWLGDGTSGCGGFTNIDDEICKKIESLGYRMTHSTKVKSKHHVLGLWPELRGLGMENGKHVPADYLRSSKEQRLELLRGLMDTDGTVHRPSCMPEFCNTNKNIIDGVYELIVSLGWKAIVKEGRAKLNGKDCGPKWTIKFSPDEKVFHLRRKADIQKTATRRTSKFRYIIDAYEVESEPGRCIEVDSPSHLYLAGAQMVPTHNSHFIRYLALWCAIFCPGIQIYIFRRTFPDLAKNHMEGPTSFPVVLAPLVAAGLAKIVYGNKMSISFPNGAKIHLCHCQYEKNVTSYQGAEIHLLLIDELTHFTEKIYRFLRGRCRLGAWKPPVRLAGVFPRILNGSNPGGIGHNWVKQTFVSVTEPMRIWRTPKEEGGMLRQFIPAKLTDNPTMEENDPDYVNRLHGLGDPALVKAMLDGNWDIVAGGALDDVWNPFTQIVKPFAIPKEWYLDRSFDWGSTAPFSVGWWARTNGEDVQLADGSWRYFPAGSLIRVNEWYGWSGKANEGCKMLAEEVAKGIKEREASMGLKFRPGPADSAIFAKQNGNCIADDMQKHGVSWLAADKGPGSRVNGLEKVRAMLKASMSDRPEEPGLYAFSHCTHYTRTMPVLPRSETNREDVDTNAEDHVYDEVRYEANMPVRRMTVTEV